MYFGTYDSFNSETNDNKTSFLIDINGGFLGLLQLALVFQFKPGFLTITIIIR